MLCNKETLMDIFFFFLIVSHQCLLRHIAIIQTHKPEPLSHIPGITLLPKATHRLGVWSVYFRCRICHGRLLVHWPWNVMLPVTVDAQERRLLCSPVEDSLTKNWCEITICLWHNRLAPPVKSKTAKASKVTAEMLYSTPPASNLIRVRQEDPLPLSSWPLKRGWKVVLQTGPQCSFCRVYLIFKSLMINGNKISNIYFYYWIDKLFLEENKVPRKLFDARKVAGSATYKQSKTLWNCVIL